MLKRARSELIKSGRVFLVVLTIWCIGYLSYQLFYALPFNHFAVLGQDIYHTIPDKAFYQAVFGYTATRDFATWGGIGFFIWQSGYFSICVWMTLFFMTAPGNRKLRCVPYVKDNLGF
jgi:hypothetical protein